MQSDVTVISMVIWFIYLCGLQRIWPVKTTGMGDGIECCLGR